MKFIGAAALATRQRREGRHGPFDRFASWFNRGFLELRRIDWQSPAAVLEKLIAYEAVHEIKGWDDLRRRLAPDRRCFAFFHPALPGEPLVPCTQTANDRAMRLAAKLGFTEMERFEEFGAEQWFGVWSAVTPSD